MIEPSFQEAFTDEWVESHLQNHQHELVILRQVVPWQSIIDGLVSLYDGTGGRFGKSLRIMVALIIVARLRQLRILLGKSLKGGKADELIRENPLHECHPHPTNGPYSEPDWINQQYR